MNYCLRLALLVTLAAGLFVALSNTAAAQRASGSEVRLEDGTRAFYAGDNQLALRSFLTLAHKGNPEAQYFLAYMFDTGQGTGQDLSEAARWYIRSAEQGHVPAIVYVGYIYASGHGVPKDREKAIEWYTKAAQMGDDIAQNNLASLLSENDDSESKHNAARWFLSSALQGNAHAQFNLANIYHRGDGIRRNLEEAAKWYHQAALQGNMHAQNALASMYMRGRGVPRDIERAMEWYRRSAEQGLEAAQFQLARVYELSAERSDVTAQTRQSHYSSAAVWYYHAAQKGYGEAAFHLSNLYRHGRGMPQDLSAAVQWLEFSIKHDYEPAKIEFAHFLETGEGGVEPDPEQALRLFEEAADTGDGKAMFETARMYYRGIGAEVDLIQAYKWFSLAVETLESGTESREQAIIARVEIANSLSMDELEEARRLISRWNADESR